MPTPRRRQETVNLACAIHIDGTTKSGTGLLRRRPTWLISAFQPLSMGSTRHRSSTGCQTRIYVHSSTVPPSFGSKLPPCRTDGTNKISKRIRVVLQVPLRYAAPGEQPPGSRKCISPRVYNHRIVLAWPIIIGHTNLTILAPEPWLRI
jgi:hypothetical protein